MQLCLGLQSHGTVLGIPEITFFGRFAFEMVNFLSCRSDNSPIPGEAFTVPPSLWLPHIECQNMSETNIKPVVIPYASLCDPNANLGAQIEEGFGYAGLGLILVSGVPNLLELREKLLPLGTKLAGISDEAKAKVELAETVYSVGWSHGKEKLREGVFGM
jgi:hypothetical protein